MHLQLQVLEMYQNFRYISISLSLVSSLVNPIFTIFLKPFVVGGLVSFLTNIIIFLLSQGSICFFGVSKPLMNGFVFLPISVLFNGQMANLCHMQLCFSIFVDEGRIRKLCFTMWASMEDVNIILPCAPFGFLGFKVHKEDSGPHGVNIYYKPLNREGACQ